ncbi:hypothetical protein PMSD_05015 [Paenibacillus macquariensis subsp. defensor]|nr:hypothetical protein PMSD_05015 [Paenibacillus macquariensis subsp. defensor]
MTQFFEDYPEIKANFFDSHELILEYPHDYFLGKEIDLVVNSTEKFIFEFKYNRRIPSKKEDTTGRMANFLIDIHKLHFSNISTQKYFVFVTDMQMYDYLLRNGYSYLINSNRSFNFSASSRHITGIHFQEIFNSKIGGSAAIPIPMSIELKQTLNNNHNLIIYKIGVN